MQAEVEDKLSEKILEGELSAGDHVHVDFEAGEFVFTTTSREAVGASVASQANGISVTPDIAADSE
jgi:ATP-dependent Clp protease ATP-binding subunit ClpC